MDLEAALKAGVIVGCSWETVALTTGLLPTLSSLFWRVPVRYRTALWGAVVALGTDHFIVRRFT